ncbi:MAG TPA: UDP-glucose/GDP-mannose dehydrogenase family protein [Desulfosalsimonadaceae bacterium]|nr:UDP-glucose/GDP-mannose dehydrogenase family protein [Desulfosalsimonadaceae bacterium]
MHLCVVGTGYVGLVAAACFAEMGNHVVCVDSNPRVLETLNSGRIHIFEPGLEDIVARNVAEQRLCFTGDLREGVASSRFIFNCVGTPPQPDGSCDLSYVFTVAEQIGRVMNAPKIVVTKSTVPVGTAERIRSIISGQLRERGVEIAVDVVSNPEFLKEGDAVNDFMKPDRIIIGTDNPQVADEMAGLYAPFARSREKLLLMSIPSAELTKYAANCMLATKISFINEIANICEKVGADIKDVRMGIGSDHRIGYHFIYPGVGYGGSCFPKDVNALIHTAADHQYNPELLQAVEGVNNRQKRMLAEKIKSFFAEKGGVQDKTLAVWGLAFKANTDDVRASAAIEIIRELTAEGMYVRAYDPAAAEAAREIFADNPGVEIASEQYAVLSGGDALAVATDWNQFRNPDFERVKNALKSPVIFDGRNLYAARDLTDMGFSYLGVGRPRAFFGA